MDLSAYLRWQNQDYEGQDIERLYVEPNAWPEGAEAPLPLLEHIDQWLAATDQLHLTLLGDYGTGKTWFTRKLTSMLAQRYLDDPQRQRLPIRIDLRDVSKALNLENILYDHLQRHAGRMINPKTILYLLAEGRLVLIFDGFDEMATQANWQETLENFRALADAAEGFAKVILTCRTHYFKAQAHVQELFQSRKPAAGEGETALYREIQERRGFRVVHLLEFDTAQIQAYLQRACGPRADEVGKAIQHIAGLRDLAARPVLLDMIVKSAPRLDQAGSAIKVADLYEFYTESWLARQDWRLRLTRDGRSTLVEELAARLWETDSARLHYRDLADVLTGLLHERLSTDRDLEIADYEVRTASFLTRDAEGNYGFSHRSFLEFFLARRTARLLREAAGDASLAIAALRYRLFSPQVLSFLLDLLPSDTLIAAMAAVLDTPYTRFSSENALHLYQAVRPARTALQRLELAGARLAGMSLVGCDLAQANLAGADLTGSDLTQANLTQANLAAAILTQVRLQGALCGGADFSQAILVGACLDAGTYRGANFAAADLSFATLVGAMLHGACLQGATIDGSSFYQAALDENALEQARYTYAPDPVHLDTQALSLIVQTGYGLITSLAYSPDGKLLAVAARGDATIRLMALVTGQRRRTLVGHAATVTALCWRPDGQQVASGSMDQTVRLWEVASGTLERTLEGHGDSVWAVAYRPDGQQLASGSGDQTVRLWSVAQGTPEHTLAGHSNGVWAVAYRPDGQQLASGSGDQTVRLWSVAQGTPEHTLAGHSNDVWAVAYRPDGQQLASGSGDHTVRLWSVAGGTLEHTLTGHSDSVLAVAYRPDGQQLASGSGDGTIRLWSVVSGKSVRVLSGLTGLVFSLAWAPDGQRLVSASLDGSMRIWDPAAGQCLVTLYQFADGGWLAVTPDGHYTGDAIGKRYVTFAHGWALYSAAMFPTLEDPEAVRAALAPPRRRRARKKHA